MRRFRERASAVAQSSIAVALLTVFGTTAEAGSNGQLLGWFNLSLLWGSTVQSSNSKYSDGDTIPLRFVASLAPGTTHTVVLKYDFSSGGSGRFFDWLGSYNQTVANASLLAGLSGTGTPSTWAIPADPSLPAKAQIPGALTTYNVSSVSFGSYTLVNGVKLLPVTFTVAGTGKANATVVFGYGGHLATQITWGVGNGASQFPGASRKAYASLDGASDQNVSVNPGAVVASADLAISMVGSPQPVPSGGALTYQITVANIGPDQATSVVVTNTLPAGETLASVSVSQGTWTGTSSLSFALGAINAGASATISIAVTVPLTGTSIANTATVASPVSDPNPANNSVTFVSTIKDTIPPTIVCPANIVQGTDPGKCSAVVTYSLTATDNNPGVTVAGSPPSGFAFPKGTTTVQGTATDAAGNISVCSFTVTVVDREPPQLTCPANLTVPTGTGRCDAIVSFAPTATDNCDGSVTVTCNPPSGSAFPVGTNLVQCSAQDTAGNTSTCAFAVVVQDAVNQTWPQAQPLALADNSGVQVGTVQQCLNSLDQSRWYRFTVQPNSRVFVTLTSLPENYDLVLFKDIAAAFSQLNSAQDLVKLSASFASDGFSPSAFSPDAFSPSAFSPSAFSPSAFSPSAFSPSAFSPSAFSPSAFSPSAFSPDAYAPSAFSPSAFSPSAFSPSAFSAAQIQSVLAVSAFDGVANEGIVANTWDNDGSFYVRVRGRNGVFSTAQPFTLSVFEVTGACAGVSAVAVDGSGQPLPPPGPAAGGNYRTVILTDLDRLTGAGTSPVRTTLTNRLAMLAARPEVAGVLIDLSQDPRVKFFNAQGDTYFDCPYAKNLVAKAIKDIVDSYRAANPLQYVVLVGGDSVIPFFRYPDEALLGPERNYVPPVKDLTPSQASLRLNYVLGQDGYGAQCSVSLKSGDLPLPDLAVGRLAETPDEIGGLIDAYLGTTGGVIATPSTALVTGYDFLADNAQAVSNELAQALGTAPDALISPNNLAPSLCWTADNLRQALFSKRHDVVFLAGHFSASETLAADYTTHVLASELAATTTDFKNALIFSAGCHSGYNIVTADGIPFVTLEPDWVQAAAQKQATLVAGTGYQYGDTDFVEYSERLYLNFAQQLRTGLGPVPVGKALLNAKRSYLAATPQMRGIHSKAYLEATLFGLPMLSLNMPGSRRADDTSTSVISGLNVVTADPGKTLGLAYVDLAVTPALSPTEVVLNNTEDGTQITATYLAGGDGIINNPAEPILPLEVRDVTFPATVLRGIGFRGGHYTDLTGKVPLTGAATTEIRGVHATFLSEVFYPMRPWSVNYFDALCGGLENATRLMVIPAQFKSDSPTNATGTIREFTEMDFRLFYSANTTTYSAGTANASTPGLAAAPSISGVQGLTSLDGSTVALSARVVGNPSAGIQAAWVTWTAMSGPNAGTWQSLDLAQNAVDSTLWQGTLPLNGIGSQSIRYMVQAVNGVGVVALDTKLGAYHIPDEFDSSNTANLNPTAVKILTAATQGAFGAKTTFSAQLTAGGVAVSGQRMVFSIGDQEVWATTDANGVASGALPLRSAPGTYEFKASFPGASGLAPSFATQSFDVTRQTTSIAITPTLVYAKPNVDTGIVGTLTDGAGNRIIERTLFFIVQGANGSYAVPVITDANGQANLGPVPLPAGMYAVTAYFNGNIPLPGGQSVTIDDGRYLPSTTAGLLTITLVVDDQPPTITCPANIVVGNDPGLGSAVVFFTVTTADNNPGVSVTTSIPSGSAFLIGTNTVNCVATDLAGNRSTCSFTVTVLDTQAPTIQSVTAAPNVLSPPNHQMVLVTVSVTAKDNYSGVTSRIVSVASSEPTNTTGDGNTSGDWLITGPLTVDLRAERAQNGPGRTYTITVASVDAAGNTAYGTTTVFVPK